MSEMRINTQTRPHALSRPHFRTPPRRAPHHVHTVITRRSSSSSSSSGTFATESVVASEATSPVVEHETSTSTLHWYMNQTKSELRVHTQTRPLALACPHFRTPPRRAPHHVRPAITTAMLRAVITTAMVIIIIIIRDIRHRVRRRERGHITRSRPREVHIQIACVHTSTNE